MKKLLKKIDRKIRNILSHTIYYNSHYRPTGVYETVQEYIKASGDAYLEVMPSYLAVRKIPKALYDVCYSNHFSVKEKDVSIQMPALFVAEIKQGRLLSSMSNLAVISKDNKIIGDISFQYNKKIVRTPEYNSSLRQRYFTAPKKYEGVLFNLSIGGGGYDNYFHWIFDIIPRVYLLKKSGWFDKVDWFIVPRYHYSFQTETLRILGIDASKVIENDKHTHIEFDTMISPAHPRSVNISGIPQWVYDANRDTFLKGPLPDVGKHPLIYLSRNDAPTRRVLNEAALIDLLQKYGFESFELSNLSFTEQVSLFSSAQYIVAPHGAALTNILFCSPGTKILEVFAEGYGSPDYYYLSDRGNLDYQYLVYKPEAKYEKEKHITVDLDEIKKLLDKAFINEQSQLAKS